MTKVRIKAQIQDEFTRSAANHIQSADLPNTYSTEGDYIYKVIPLMEYNDMEKSLDGVNMVELGIPATLDKNWGRQK